MNINKVLFIILIPALSYVSTVAPQMDADGDYFKLQLYLVPVLGLIVYLQWIFMSKGKL